MNPTNASPAMIEVNNVIRRFKVGDGEVTILKGISFEIGRGEFVSIVGPSGNGRSTLANDPPLLVADEPTDNLDTRTASDILRNKEFC